MDDARLPRNSDIGHATAIVATIAASDRDGVGLGGREKAILRKQEVEGIHPKAGATRGHLHVVDENLYVETTARLRRRRHDVQSKDVHRLNLGDWSSLRAVRLEDWQQLRIQ